MGKYSFKNSEQNIMKLIISNSLKLEEMKRQHLNIKNNTYKSLRNEIKQHAKLFNMMGKKHNKTKNKKKKK
jgi:hypothetical protein